MALSTSGSFAELIAAIIQGGLHGSEIVSAYAKLSWEAARESIDLPVRRSGIEMLSVIWRQFKPRPF